MLDEACSVALGLGSNLGDSRAHLGFAVRRLAGILSAVRVSSLYETLPMHRTDQPLFLNACCTGSTGLAPAELLARLKELESEAGREPGPGRYAPRPLDLDILLYGEQMIEGPNLIVPHPRLAERAFVLVPLAEIAGGWQVPGTGLSVAEHARRVALVGVRRVAGPGWEQAGADVG